MSPTSRGRSALVVALVFALGALLPRNLPAPADHAQSRPAAPPVDARLPGVKDRAAPPAPVDHAQSRPAVAALPITTSS